MTYGPALLKVSAHPAFWMTNHRRSHLACTTGTALEIGNQKDAVCVFVWLRQKNGKFLCVRQCLGDVFGRSINPQMRWAREGPHPSCSQIVWIDRLGERWAYRCGWICWDGTETGSNAWKQENSIPWWGKHQGFIKTKVWRWDWRFPQTNSLFQVQRVHSTHSQQQASSQHEGRECGEFGLHSVKLNPNVPQSSHRLKLFLCRLLNHLESYLIKSSQFIHLQSYCEPYCGWNFL